MVVKPRTRREEDKEKRRAEIVETASRLFAEHGLENVSFTDIARATRLSRPLIYFYFPDLETLFLSAVLESTRRLHARFQEAVKKGRSGREQIEEIGRAYVAYHREHPDAFYLFSAYEARPGRKHALEGAIMQAKMEMNQTTAETLRRGCRDGSIRRDIPDPAVLSLCLWGFVHGLAQVAVVKSDTLTQFKVPPDTLVEQGFRFMRAAFGGRD